VSPLKWNHLKSTHIIVCEGNIGEEWHGTSDSSDGAKKTHPRSAKAMQQYFDQCKKRVRETNNAEEEVNKKNKDNLRTYSGTRKQRQSKENEEKVKNEE